MALNHPKRRTIPLFCRQIVLRILLTSAVVNLLLGVPLIAFGQFGWRIEFGPDLPLTLIVCPVTPLFTILHHTLRLWPRRYWLVVWEVFVSLAEAALVGAILLPNFTLALQEIPIDPGDLAASITVLYGVASLIVTASSFLAFVFLLFDLFNQRGKDILHQYDFSAGLCRPGRQWSFIWGSWTTRKRFSTDTIFIRCLRGGLAIICLFGILSLLLYSVVWKPIQANARPGVKISKVPVLEGDVFGTLLSILGEVVITFQIVLTVSGPLAASEYYPNVTVSRQFIPPNYQYFRMDDCETQSLVEFGSVIVHCSWKIFPNDATESFEPLIIIDFADVPYKLTEAPHEFELRLGASDVTVGGILNDTDPILLHPGSNLYGLAVISVKERFSGKESAALGVPQYHQFPVVNMRALSPDWISSIPRNNHTATLRVVIRSQPYIYIEQDYLEGSSVLNGFALIGGVWTLINGIFAAIFGSTLLLVLFGIKPLSIYGLVHFFQSGRGSLVDANYVLSPEERDRIVGILREHLLDVEDIEGDSAAPVHYNRVSTVPSVRPFT